MENPYRRISRALPTASEWTGVFGTLTKKEFWGMFCLAAIAVVSGLIFLIKANNTFTVTVPARGGAVSEGIIGTPRFVNPILAFSDADKDLVALVYSGLMRRTPAGDFVPDLAETYNVSDDGLVYTFTLKENLTFHDGTPVTADDVIYTVSAAKDPIIKSPKKVNWDGVTVVKKDDRTIVFTLKQRYASFIDATTLGILPAHLYHDLTPEQFGLSNLNIEAVGSGPYKVSGVNRTSSGIPSSYDLAAFKKFALGEPYINSITMRFYANEKELTDAWKNDSVGSINAISPDTAQILTAEGAHVITATLPRIFGLFFNQTQAPIFTDPSVARAFDKAIDKGRIVREVLADYGTVASGPIPEGLLNTEELADATAGTPAPDIAGAEKILTTAGWVKGDDGIYHKKDKKSKAEKRLSFSISTSDAPELKKAADIVVENLRAIGVEADVKVFETGTLNQNIIRPRKYDVLFFGQTVNHDTDLYAFWHSSQRNDPGLNIALYANARADKDLEQANGTLDAKKRNALYTSFAGEVTRDMPAIFIYSPKFIYVTSGRASDVMLDHIISPSDRFLSVHTWFVETDHVWKVFAPKN